MLPYASNTRSVAPSFTVTPFREHPMNAAKQSIDLLDVLTLDELRALSDEELRRFEALLSHWQQLAQGERQKRFAIGPRCQPRNHD